MLMGILKGGTVGGGAINPTRVTLSSTYFSPGGSGTVTIDPSKDYMFFASFKNNDTTYRQEIQYISNGVVTSLTDNNNYTYVNLCTISGTTLTYSASSGSSVKIDISLFQLN